VAGAFFQHATGTRYQFVPYRGLAPAMQGLLAGEVQIMIGAPADSLTQIAAGNLKAYAVLGKNRRPDEPIGGHALIRARKGMPERRKDHR
jgi:tripartite-type tricarboxylate transporter receptor subunit TctC